MYVRYIFDIVMASLQSALRKRYERKIPTSIYEDNYGYTINFYQPMIDYLDAKQRGISAQYPHLPWTNERGLKKFWSSNSVRPYTSADIHKHSCEVYEHAKNRERDLDDYKIIHRSPLAVSKSAIGARLHRRLTKYDDNIEEKVLRKLEEREDEKRVAKIMDDIDHIKARFNAHKELKISSGLKSQIRGKTANQIAEAILAESEKNIKESRNQEDLLITQAKSQLQLRKGNIVKRTIVFDMVDDRMIDHLDSKVSSSLCDVKRQLQSFNQRSNDLYLDSRWRKSHYK